MAKIKPFEKHESEYGAWFENNRFVYESEVLAIKEQLPDKGQGIEVGVGRGRFAAPSGIKFGIEPIKEDYGDGSFVVVKALKPKSRR
ncbi:hypothetical protein ES703_42644 [subsurface metagenome]